ncbi:FadD7 family fatty acid--CoA ligase [Actinacidiphila soli]|uniref:FadD7 family fatty acid--CoA ligase n=1 Tax=Actinacidiphila soli TaxID=2487275 RepID=UPI000FCA8F75|nr:FadD7 family fatty acid--CoA ligase [Actinacidiphila soli]
MAVPTAASVRNTNRYRPPAITGLADLLDRQVRERPHARALVVTGDRLDLSYRALAALAEDVAARLRGTGLRRGDAVGLVCANTCEFVVALLGAARAGLVIAPIDPALPESQMSARLEALGAQAVLAGPPPAGAAPAQDHVPPWTLRVDISRAGTATATLETGARVVRHVRGAAHELSSHDALVLFTAGTTAQAKMVPLTHANVAESVRGICDIYELGPGDATVAVMPFFHGHGLFAALLATLASGGCVLLPERGRFSAHTFWDDVRAVSATWFTAVPTIHEILLDRSAREYPGPEIAPLKFVRSCSAPLNTATQRALERTLGAPLLSAYGMTETTHQATSEPLPKDGLLKQGSVGRSTGVDLRVVDRDGHPCPPGTEGEVWVHGPTITRGYLANPAETAKSFADGWFRTGDLGSLDEDGYLFLTGRIKNLINRGGEKISPEHVEDIIAGCPGVAEVAVFAIPDATYGQRVGAVVVVRDSDSTGSEQILQYCRNRLSAFEVPDRLDVVAALPHTAKGGLDRKAVDAQYAR